MKTRASCGVLVSALLAGCAQITGLSDLKIGTVGSGGDAGLDASSGSGGSSSGGSSGSGGASASTGGSSGTAASGGAGAVAAGGGAADAGDESAGGAAAEAGLPDGGLHCTGKPGPVMVPADGFCIDSTEVTAGQYRAFVSAATAQTISGQSAECVWNRTVTPADEWPPPSNALDEPVRYVDWCDAQAYCKWAGKRLCGKIGGGAVPYDRYASSDASQWMHACTSGNPGNTFPYGSTYDPTACDGEDLHPYNEVLIDVGTMALCHGFDAYQSVFDMSGNVLEWEDSCETNPAPEDGGTGPGTDLCRIRGGSILSGEAGLSCDADFNEPRNHAPPLVGFRCCVD